MAGCPTDAGRPATGTSVALAPLVALCAMHPLTVSLTAPTAASVAQTLAMTHSAVSATFAAFMLAAALGQVLFGPLSDVFGRLPMLGVGLVLFVAGSLLCAAAEGWSTFLAGRLLQGAGGVGLVVGRAVARDVWSGREVQRRFATLAAGMALVSVVAPVLGAVAVGHAGWRGVSLALAAFGLAALAVVQTMPETRPAAAGATLARWRREATELASLARFWLHAATLAALAAPYFALVAGGSAFAASRGFPPIAVGVAVTTVGAGCFAGAMLSRALAAAAPDLDAVIVGGVLGIAGVSGFALLLLLAGAAPAMLIAPLLLLGLGNGLAIPPAIAGAIGLRPRLAGTAAGVVGAAQIAGGAAAGAVVSILAAVPAACHTPLPVLLPMMLGAAAALGCGIALRDRPAGRLALHPA